MVSFGSQYVIVVSGQGSVSLTCYCGNWSGLMVSGQCLCRHSGRWSVFAVGSAQLNKVSKRSEKHICAPTCLSEVFQRKDSSSLSTERERVVLEVDRTQRLLIHVTFLVTICI